jgi:Protein kinase domain
VRPQGVGLEEAQRRIRREAQTMAQLPSASCVVVHEVGSHDGQLFIAMELMPGGTLRDWLAVPRRRDAVIARFVAVGRRLAVAHAAGIVHRDFKPENVLVGANDDVRISDFGLARAISGTPSTAPGGEKTGVAGTPAYMPPEQLRGEAVDARSDQFSFAVAFYDALEGARPYGATAEPGRALRDFGRTPPWLAKILARGLARDPADRWPALGEMLDAIERGARRRQQFLVGGALTLLVGGVIVTTAIVAHRPVPPAPPARPASPAPPRSPIAWRPQLISSTFSEETVPMTVARNGVRVHAVGREWWVRELDGTDQPRHTLPDQVATGDWSAAPDAQRFYISGKTTDDNRVWELARDGSLVRIVTYPVVDQLVYASPDGKNLLVAEPRDPALAVDVRVVDLGTLASRELLHQARVMRAAWSPDGRQIALLLRDKPDTLVIIDVATAQRRDVDPVAAPATISNLAWTTSALVVALDFDRHSRLESWLVDGAGHRTEVTELYELPPLTTVRWLETTRDTLYVQTIGNDMHLYEIGLAPVAAPRRLGTNTAADLAAIGWTAQHELVFTAMAAQLRTLQLPAHGPARVVSEEVAVAVADDAIWLRSTDAAKRRTTFSRVGHPETPVLEVDAPRAAIACAGDQHAPCVVLVIDDPDSKPSVTGTLHRWVPGSSTLGPELVTFEMTSNEQFALSPDGNQLAIGRTGAIELVDLTTRRSTKIGVDADANYLAVTWALDGTLYASVAIDDRADCRILRLIGTNLETVQRDPGCSAFVYGIKVRPDGKALVVHRQSLTWALYRVPL